MKPQLNRILLLQFLLLALSTITAIQKISAAGVPDWFVKKFEPTLIAAFPFGIPASYYIITVLEAVIALVILISLISREWISSVDKKWLSFGLDLSMLLFLILFFGSFLAGDYDNGALDFMYFGFCFYFRESVGRNR